MQPTIKLGSITLVIGCVLAYLLMAPPGAFIGGFDLGAEGLAVKMLLIQFLNVSIVCYITVTRMGWSFHILYQFSSLIVFLAAAATSDYFVGLMMNLFALPYILGLLSYALGYILIIFLMFSYFPKTIGFSFWEVNALKTKVRLLISQL